MRVKVFDRAVIKQPWRDDNRVFLDLSHPEFIEDGQQAMKQAQNDREWRVPNDWCLRGIKIICLDKITMVVSHYYVRVAMYNADHDKIDSKKYRPGV